MIKITLDIDARIINAIDRMAEARHSTRAQVVRDAVYYAVWVNRKGFGQLPDSPRTIRHVNDLETSSRILNTTLVEVDSDGLVVERGQ